MDEKIIGIDLLNTDEHGGMYALCESSDGGETWDIVENGRAIEGLLDVAKSRYDETIPMILPFQIREMLRYEIIEQREWKRINGCAKTENSIKPSWWQRFIRKFRR